MEDLPSLYHIFLDLSGLIRIMMSYAIYDPFRKQEMTSCNCLRLAKIGGLQAYSP